MFDGGTLEISTIYIWCTPHTTSSSSPTQELTPGQGSLAMKNSFLPAAVVFRPILEVTLLLSKQLSCHIAAAARRVDQKSLCSPRQQASRRLKLQSLLVDKERYLGQTSKKDRGFGERRKERSLSQTWFIDSPSLSRSNSLSPSRLGPAAATQPVSPTPRAPSAPLSSSAHARVDQAPSSVSSKQTERKSRRRSLNPARPPPTHRSVSARRPLALS